MFSRNDRKLRGTTGAVTVLHTHNRRLDYHPHVHLVMPSAAFDNKRRRWRNKDGGICLTTKRWRECSKMLAGIKQAELKLPRQYPEKWWWIAKRWVRGRRHWCIWDGICIAGYCPRRTSCKPRWQRHFPLPEQRNPQDGNPHSQRRGIPAPDPATHSAQRLPPRPQLRLSHPNSKLIPLVQLIKRVVLPTATRPVIRCKCCGGVMKILSVPVGKIFAHRLRTLRQNGLMFYV